jgi:hypothetical protein
MNAVAKICCSLALSALASALPSLAADGRMLVLQPTDPNDFDAYARVTTEPTPKAAAIAPESADKDASRAEQRALLNRVSRARTSQKAAGQVMQQAGCRAEPSSPAIGADVPESYFGPPPVLSNPSLVGPLQLLTSGPLDTRERTITIPLYRGEMTRSGVTRPGESVWYILTDTTDQGNAEALGLNFAPKLNYAATGRGVRQATLTRDGLLVFHAGRVDFTPERQVVAGGRGERAFPPVVAEPGSIGDEIYTPLVNIGNAGEHVYNAPVVAFGVEAEEIHFPDGGVDYSKVHDSVVAIDTVENTVTIALPAGFSFGRPVLYMSMDTSTPDTAALESATFAPGLQDIEVGNDDSAFSAVERIFVFSNGAVNCDNPHRQGLAAAINDGETPFNVLGGIPTLALDYSPLWDVNLGEWTQQAITERIRARLIDEFQILSFVEFGFVTGPGGAEYGSVGAIVNCPIVFRFL